MGTVPACVYEFVTAVCSLGVIGYGGYLSNYFVHNPEFTHSTSLPSVDNSITWNRSALNARCRICRRKGDPEKMLLCDGCDKGHHMYCLKPLLTVVPEGDWYVFICDLILLSY